MPPGDFGSFDPAFPGAWMGEAPSGRKLEVDLSRWLLESFASGDKSRREKWGVQSLEWLNQLTLIKEQI